MCDSGEWKLWGLDIACDLSNGSEVSFFQIADRHIDTVSTNTCGALYRAPERANGDWDRVTRGNGACDIWAIGALIKHIYAKYDVPVCLSEVLYPSARGVEWCGCA